MSSDEISASCDAVLRLLLLVLVFLVLVFMFRDFLIARFRSDDVFWYWAGSSVPQYHDVARLIIEGHKIAPDLLALLIFYCV